MSMLRKRTIMAVDDDEINLMILVKTAEDMGFAVTSFCSGDAAWQYLDQNPRNVDIALVDKMMPGISGIELLKLIKDDPFLKIMPVIIQTGDAGIEQMRQGLEQGARYYLIKPFHPDSLMSTLRMAAKDCELRDELMAQQQVNLINLRSPKSNVQ